MDGRLVTLHFVMAAPSSAPASSTDSGVSSMTIVQTLVSLAAPYSACRIQLSRLG
jgi:hypothetical protein